MDPNITIMSKEAREPLLSRDGEPPAKPPPSAIEMRELPPVAPVVV